MKYQHLSNNRRSRRGFSTVELLVASSIFLALIGVAFQFTTSSLTVQAKESQQVELQQNIRSALQLISQDIRSSNGLHLINSATCQPQTPCSNNTEITTISANGTITAVREPANANFSNSTQTRVCDARNYSAGSTAVLLNVDVDAGNTSNIESAFLDITGVNITANHAQSCSFTNSDTITHNSVSGAWTTSSHISQALVANYHLEADPTDATRNVLFRRTGLTNTNPQTGIVAFNIVNLKIEYGVKVDNSPLPLTFYPDLATAAAAYPNYSDFPNNGQPYIGNSVQLIKVSITGETRKAKQKVIVNGNTSYNRAQYTLSETIELRR